MKRTRTSIAVLLALHSALIVPLLAADTPRVDVADLEKSEEWIGRRVELEGRVASRAPDRLRLEKSGVDFRFTPSPRIAPFRLERVLIVGTLLRDGDTLRFEIDSLQTLPSEEEEFRQRQQQTRPNDVRQWYALGQWARQRAVFYDDASLAPLADDAYRRGLSAEERQTGDRPEALRALSRFARDEAGLPDEAARLTLRSFQVEFSAIAHYDVEALTNLARRLAGALPGCDEPLTRDDAELARRATSDLDRVYRGATDAQRRKLHRVLWADVTERLLAAKALVAPGQTLHLAGQADETLPDRPTFAEALKRRGLDEQSGRISELSPDQALAVAEGYRSLSPPQPDRAAEVLGAWFQARREQLGERDADGRLALARSAISMLGDRQLAAALLQEAWQLAPELPGLADELRRLGLVRVGSRWTEADAAPNNRDAEMERLIRRGQVVPGMTESQLLRSLRPPDRVTRIATSRHVLEQWIFTGSVTMRVNLVRDRARGVAEVISVHSGL